MTNLKYNDVIFFRRDKMKAALYVRVSTEDQTVDNQTIILKEYCIRNNIDVYNVYAEEGVSGTKVSRPALNNMLFDMRAGLFDTIIIWKLDRLGRSLQHLLQILEELNRREIGLVITTMNIDTKSSVGKLFFSVSGAFAEFERELISERVKAGLARAKSQGAKIGKRGKDKKPRRKSGYYMRWINNPRIKKYSNNSTRETPLAA